MAVTVNQRTYRIRTDSLNANTGTPTWAAAEGKNYYPGLDTNFRLRFSINNTGNSTSNAISLRRSLNYAAYATVTTGTTGIIAADASVSVDNLPITTGNFLLSAGTGGAVTGQYDESGTSTGTIAASSYSEYEFGLQLASSTMAVGDTVDLHLYQGSQAFDTFTLTPRFIRPEDAGTYFAHDKWLGSNGVAGADQATLVLTTTEVAAVGKLVVIVVACDNNQTTDGDEGAVTGVTDSGGNLTWTKAIEFTNGQGGAQAGATCSIWYAVLTAQINAGGTITVAFSNATSRDATAITAKSYTIAAGILIKDVTATLATDAADPGSLNATSSNAECLRIRGIAMEYTGANDITKTAGWVPWFKGAGSTGTTATSMSVYAESTISTGTSAASDPTIASADCASCYVAFRIAYPQALTPTRLVSTNITNYTTMGPPIYTGGSFLGGRPIGAGALATETVSAGFASQGLTPTIFTSATAAYGTPVITRGSVGLTATKFTSATVSYKIPVVGRGTISLTPTKFTSATVAYGIPTVGKGSVGLTPTKFTSATVSYKIPVITRGSVGLTATKFTSATVSYKIPVFGSGLTATKFTSATVSYGAPVIGGSIGLTATKFTSATVSYGTPVITRGPVGLSATKFTSATVSYKIPVITRGSVGLSATKFTSATVAYGVPIFGTGIGIFPPLFTSIVAYGTPGIGRGAISLTSTKYTNSNTFGVPNIVSTYDLIQAKYINSQTYQTQVLDYPYDLIQTKYTNTQAYQTQVLDYPYDLVSDNYTNTQTYGTPTIGRGQIDLIPTIYNNISDYIVPFLSTAGQIVFSVIENHHSFGTPSIGRGQVGLIGNIFNEINIFYTQVIDSTYGLTATEYTNVNILRQPIVGRGLLPTKLSLTNVYGIPTIGRGQVGLIGNKFSEINVTYTQVISSTYGLNATEYTNVNILRQPIVGRGLHPTKLVNTNTYGIPTIGRGTVGLHPSKYTNIKTFGQPIVGRGLHPTKFNNTNVYKIPTIGRGSLNLVPIKVDNSQSFKIPTIGRGPIHLVSTKFLNVKSYGQPTIGRGSVNLTTTKYTNISSFHHPIIGRGSVNLAQIKYDNIQSYQNPTIIGQYSLNAHSYINSSFFGIPTIGRGQVDLFATSLNNIPVIMDFMIANNLNPAKYINVSVYGIPTVSPEIAYILAHRYIETQRFYHQRIKLRTKTYYDHEDEGRIVIEGDIFHGHDAQANNTFMATWDNRIIDHSENSPFNLIHYPKYGRPPFISETGEDAGDEISHIMTEANTRIVNVEFNIRSFDLNTNNELLDIQSDSVIDRSEHSIFNREE